MPQVKLPEDQEERALFLLEKATEALDSAKRIVQEKRFAVAQRDVQYGVKFLACAFEELVELAQKE